MLAARSAVTLPSWQPACSVPVITAGLDDKHWTRAWMLSGSDGSMGFDGKAACAAKGPTHTTNAGQN